MDRKTNRTKRWIRVVKKGFAEGGGEVRWSEVKWGSGLGWGEVSLLLLFKPPCCNSFFPFHQFIRWKRNAILNWVVSHDCRNEIIKQCDASFSLIIPKMFQPGRISNEWSFVWDKWAGFVGDRDNDVSVVWCDRPETMSLTTVTATPKKVAMRHHFISGRNMCSINVQWMSSFVWSVRRLGGWDDRDPPRDLRFKNTHVSYLPTFWR